MQYSATIESILHYWVHHSHFKVPLPITLPRSNCIPHYITDVFMLTVRFLCAILRENSDGQTAIQVFDGCHSPSMVSFAHQYLKGTPPCDFLVPYLSDLYFLIKNNTYLLFSIF